MSLGGARQGQAAAGTPLRVLGRERGPWGRAMGPCRGAAPWGCAQPHAQPPAAFQSPAAGPSTSTTAWSWTPAGSPACRPWSSPRCPVSRGGVKGGEPSLFSHLKGIPSRWHRPGISVLRWSWARGCGRAACRRRQGWRMHCKCAPCRKKKEQKIKRRSGSSGGSFHLPGR